MWPMLIPLMFWQGDTKDLILPLQEDDNSAKPVRGTLDDQAPSTTIPHQGE
jgi:hypothetical protein